MKITPKQQEWLTANNRTLPIKCKVCDNHVKWQASKGKYGIYCGNDCRYLDILHIREKMKATNLVKYGHTNPRSSEVVKAKNRATNLERYGHENIAHGTKKEKVKATNLERYGTEHHKHRHMVEILPLLNNKEWLAEQYTTKSSRMIANELGVTLITILRKLWEFGIDTKDKRACSKSQILWLESLNNPNMLHGKNGGEWTLVGSNIKVDGFDPTTNTVYEFHGDYWHGNPQSYRSDDINKNNKKTFGELYRKTKEREQQIIELGYNLVVMWERDWWMSQQENPVE